jgi:hypothetical protein
MIYLKTYEQLNNKLKKYIEIKLLNLIIIAEVIQENFNYIKVQKLYTYDTINKTLTKNNEEPTTLIYDNFTKESIGRQSDNINDLIDTLEIEQDINKYNL